MTSWDELVTAATVGTEARPVALAGLAGPAAVHAETVRTDDPAATVLDAAALLASARRAGLTLSDEPIPARTPAPDDDVPELSPTAAGMVLAELARNSNAMVARLLEMAAEAGRRLPPTLIPALLDASVRDSTLRPATAGVLGRRGEWLAAYRSDWTRVADHGAPPVADDPAVWETGTRPERRAYLAALRERDPAAARELLAAGWKRETGEDREAFIHVLATGLDPADEDFLETALDDRKTVVRDEAARMLARLPGTAYQRRMIERARPLLRIERQKLRNRLVVELPAEFDRSMKRDGLEQALPASIGIGEKAWWLTQIIRAAPLSLWTESLGTDPETLVRLPITDGYEWEVRGGWRGAAKRERHARWARALLGTGADLPDKRHFFAVNAWTSDSALAGALPEPERIDWLVQGLRKDASTGRYPVEQLGSVPRPWSEQLSDAVVEWLLARGRGDSAHSYRYSAAWYQAQLGLPTGPRDYAEELRRLLPRVPDGWQGALTSMADAVELRRNFARELS